MAAIEPAGEKIVRNLQQAVERLQEDLTRVELWAGALGGFTKPVPEYGHGQTRFDLPQQSGTKSKSVELDKSHHRKTIQVGFAPRFVALRRDAKIGSGNLLQRGRFQPRYRANLIPWIPSKTATESTY